MTRAAPSSPSAPPSAEPAASPPGRPPGVRALIRAVGGPRYVVALAVDSIGAGLLRPFLLLYGIDVLHLAALTADRKSTRLNSSHTIISYAVFCLDRKSVV